MTRLALDAAPAVASPRRFLETAPAWGAFAGVLLLAAGPAALHTRWHPAMLAATHAFTLGVFGNLLFGSLLQFLPAVVGTNVRGGPRAARLLHALLNLGTLLLVLELYGVLRALFVPACVLLSVAFILFVAMTAPGLLCAHGQRLLRAGLGIGFAAALATAALGVGLALTLAGWIVLPLPDVVDVHAACGLLGWVLTMLFVVGRVVMPMFQGAARLPTPAAAAWLGGVAFALPLAAAARLVRADSTVPVLVVVVAGVTFALGVLWLQWRSTHRRNPPLRAFWCAGAVALIAATVALPVGDGLLAGVLAIAVALPLLTCGMQLEIAAFLGWIDLHRRCGRGTSVPSVQHLLPDADRWRVFASFLAVALLLPAAVQWSSWWLAQAASLALIGSRVMLWRTLRGVRRRATQFLAESGA